MLELSGLKLSLFLESIFVFRLKPLILGTAVAKFDR